MIKGLIVIGMRSWCGCHDTSPQPQSADPGKKCFVNALSCPEGDFVLKKMNTDNIQDSVENH